MKVYRYPHGSITGSVKLFGKRKAHHNRVILEGKRRAGIAVAPPPSTKNALVIRHALI